MAISARSLRRHFQAAWRDRTPQRFWENLQEGLENNDLPVNEFSYRELFEEFVPNGRELVREFNPRLQGNPMMLFEAGSAVDLAAFTNISGAVIQTALLEAYNDPAFIGDSLVTKMPTSFDGERIPGMTRLGDGVEDVMEGEEFPLVGFGEEWQDTPRMNKKGLRVALTKEAIWFDRTGLINSRAGEVGTFLGVNKEKRILDEVLGITNSYNRSGSGVIATYGNSSGSHDWDNLSASTPLVDWTDIETVELLFDAITDPNTGEPVAIEGQMELLVPSGLRRTAKRIVSATEVSHVDNQANAATYRTTGGNPIEPLPINTSRYVGSRSGSQTTWFMGAFKKAFWYMENWPITVITAPTGSDDEFKRDIVAQWRASERGTPFTHDPRWVAKATA